MKPTPLPAQLEDGQLRAAKDALLWVSAGGHGHPPTRLGLAPRCAGLWTALAAIASKRGALADMEKRAIDVAKALVRLGAGCEMTIGGRIGAAADEGGERCRVIATVESSRGAVPRFIWVAGHWSGTRAKGDAKRGQVQAATLMAPFRSFFTAPVWEHLQVLVIGIMLAPGKRTVSAPCVMGLGTNRDFAPT